MKKTLLPILSLLIGITFLSCDTFYFDQPQPVDAVDLNEMPEVLIGSWKGADCEGQQEDCILTISSCSFTFPVDEAQEQTYTLSDSIRLRKGQQYYWLSHYQEGWWELMAIELIGPDEIRVYDPSFERIYVPGLNRYYTFDGNENWHELEKPAEDVFLITHLEKGSSHGIYFIRGCLESEDMWHLVKKDAEIGHFRRINPPPPEHEIK